MKLDDLIDWKNQGNKIAIFCAGKIGIAMYEIFKRCGLTINCFFDNDFKKHNREVIDGCYCLEPCGIEDKSQYIVFIGILDTYYKTVEEDVKSKGFDFIVDFVDFFDDIIINHSVKYTELIQWFQNYPLLEVFHVRRPNKNSTVKAYEPLKNKKIAIYTGIFGEYDNLYNPKIDPPNVDYYFISDEEPEELGSYQWIPAQNVIPVEITSPIKKNRYIKMHPHLLFPQYEYSIYVDGNIKIERDISSFVRNCKSGISVFMHPRRDCIFYEAITIVNYRRVVAEDVCVQMAEYLAQGMPVHYGMPEMSVIAREHNNPICIKVMNEWWSEFMNGAQRDQLSFMYVMWRNNLTVDDIASLGSDYRQSDFFHVIKHNKESHKILNDKYSV